MVRAWDKNWRGVFSILFKSDSDWGKYASLTCTIRQKIENSYLQLSALKILQSLFYPCIYSFYHFWALQLLFWFLFMFLIRQYVNSLLSNIGFSNDMVGGIQGMVTITLSEHLIPPQKYFLFTPSICFCFVEWMHVLGCCLQCFFIFTLLLCNAVHLQLDVKIDSNHHAYMLLTILKSNWYIQWIIYYIFI